MKRVLALHRPVFITPEDNASLPVEATRRLRRLRAMAWFLDRSFSIAGKHFGFDPLIGFIPAVGDLIGALLSLYILYEAARLGIPWSILLRMAWNILVDTLLGEIPVIGDAFDFVWQSNTWNIELVEKYLSPGLRPRPVSKILGILILIALILVGASVGFSLLLVLGIWKLFHS